MDNISGAFGENKRQFTITRNGVRYEPTVDEYVIAIYDNKLMIPKIDFFIDGDQFIFKEAPLNGRILNFYAIEAPIPHLVKMLLDMLKLVMYLTGITVNNSGINIDSISSSSFY